MAIVFDASSAGVQTTTANNISWSHTCTGSDLILWVAVTEETADDITGVTYNSVSLTSLTKSGTVTGAGFSQLWYLINPATGANTVQVNRTGTTGKLTGCSASYTGVKQSGQPDAQNTNTATSVTSITTSVTTIANNCWTIAGFDNSVGGVTGGAGTTIRQAGQDASGIADSNAPITPAGSTSLILENSSSNWTMAMASFAPAVSGVTVIKKLSMLMGIGQ